MTDDGYKAALSFFRAVEHTPMDEEHEDIAETLVKEYGEDAILRGLALVAAVMRDALQEHARKLGCNCGSDEWLEALVYKNAEEGGHHDA